MTAPGTILVVDDDPPIRRLVVGGLERFGLGRFLTAEDGEAAKRVLEEEEVDVVVTDLQMPRVDGLELMRWAQAACPGPQWIVLSGVGDFDVAVETMHCGAFDFVPKPVKVEELAVTVRNALEKRVLLRERERLIEDLQASTVELLGKVRELERRSETIKKDLERAQVIQRALLPAKPPVLDGVRVDALYRPGRKVGGDLYDVAPLDERRVALYVADATGHGVASAMLSVLFKQRLEMRDEDDRVLEPAEVLRRANARITGDVRAPGLFLTAAYAVLDTRSRELRVASGGHPPLVLRRSSGEVSLLERTGPALGLTGQAEYGEHRVVLERGDRLLLYTDGLLNGLDASRTERTLGAGLAQDLRTLFRDALERARAVAAEEDIDDVTLLRVEAGDGPSHFDNEPEEIGAPVEAPRVAPPSGIFVADGRGETVLAVRGRGTWSQCETFLRVAREAPDLVIDLERCTHLDSAFLGTIHEVVSKRAGHVRLHRPSADVRALMEELGLDSVLATVSDEPIVLDGEPRPVRRESSDRESQLRLLHAHETLAELSSENRERFAGVIAALRAELGEG